MTGSQINSYKIEKFKNVVAQLFSRALALYHTEKIAGNANSGQEKIDLVSGASVTVGNVTNPNKCTKK